MCFFSLPQQAEKVHRVPFCNNGYTLFGSPSSVNGWLVGSVSDISSDLLFFRVLLLQTCVADGVWCHLGETF
jgi:hypothetical protein